MIQPWIQITIVLLYSLIVLSQEPLLSRPCSKLLLGQFMCQEPVIDADTQQPAGCTKTKQTVKVDCLPAPGIECDGKVFDGKTPAFQLDVPCQWTNGKSFETALLLSIFLGMFGLDRFYLGYPAVGLLKFCTLGFMFVGQLVDVILIAMQVLKPADGSEYVIDYYGARLTKILYNNETAVF